MTPLHADTTLDPTLTWRISICLLPVNTEVVTAIRQILIVGMVPFPISYCYFWLCPASFLKSVMTFVSNVPPFLAVDLLALAAC